MTTGWKGRPTTETETGMKLINIDILMGFHAALVVANPKTEAEAVKVLHTYAAEVGVDPNELEVFYTLSAVMLQATKEDPQFLADLEAIANGDYQLQFDHATIN